MKLITLEKWLHKYPEDIPRLFLIGGSVRDMMLNVQPKDVDLTCKGARDFAYNLAAYHNAAIVPMEKKPHTPCYRVVDREDCSNYLDIAEIRGGTIYDDLMQRDFTINAMALEVNRDGTISEPLDPLNGAQDIKNGIIKSVRQDTLVSDPLRMVRAFRFSAVLGFDIEVLTLDAIRKNVGLLTTVSGERILSELLLILGTTHSTQFIKQMDQIGILEAIFPEIRAMKGCSQNAFHHKDVWEHSLLVMENCEEIINNISTFFGNLSRERDRPAPPPSLRTGLSGCEGVRAGLSGEVAANLGRNNRLPLTKLAALLHDVGKPVCREVNPDTGRITFYRHDEKGTGLMDEIAVRLRMSNRDRDFLKLLIAEHLHVLSLSKHDVKPATKMRWFRKMKDDAVPSAIVAIADIKSTSGPDSSAEWREDFMRWSKETIKEYYEVIKNRLERRDLITGRDLMTLGMVPGPEMGRILEQIRSAQDAGELNNHDEALALARQLLYR
ncbi:MAG: HD domain-containing protein [Nitrospirae bacterium]|nr:HD domain-containing protein [Nitrospirota bacterium]